MTQSDYDKLYTDMVLRCAQKLMHETKLTEKSLDDIQVEAKSFATKLLGPRPVS